jgi:hypothetical protein
MFLKLMPGNKNPKVIGRLYLEHLQNWRHLPRRVRLDLGTETGHLMAIQVRNIFCRRGIVLVSCKLLT